MMFKTLIFFITLFFVYSSFGGESKVISNGVGIHKVSTLPVGPKCSFVKFNRSKNVESNTPSKVKESPFKRNVVLSKLADKRNQKLVLVASGTLVFSVTCYKFVSKLLKYYLYDKYVMRDSPGVVNTIGHVLLKNTPDLPNRTFMEKVVKPVSAVFERMPVVKGFVRPGLRRVSTASVVKKDTLVLLYFYSHRLDEAYKKVGSDPLRVVMDKYESLRNSGKNVELVMVDLSPGYDKNYESFRGRSCYSVPFEDKATKYKMAAMLGVSPLPNLVVLDSEGNVVSENCVHMPFDTRFEFPWANLKLLDLLPDNLYNSSGQPVSKSSLKGKLLGVYLDSGNPESGKKMREKLKDLYDFMTKATDGNFEMITLKYCNKKSDYDELLRDNHPSWLTVGPEDEFANLLVASKFGLNQLLGNFALVDQEGNLYTNYGVFLLDKRLYQGTLNALLKGSMKVKDGDLAHCHLMSRPTLVVLADSLDQGSLEDLKVELNKALLTHRRRRKGRQFEFLLLDDKKQCEQTRQLLKLDKKTQMFVIGAFNDLFKYKGKELNETSVLKFIQDYYSF